MSEEPAVPAATVQDYYDMSQIIVMSETMSLVPCKRCGAMVLFHYTVARDGEMMPEDEPVRVHFQWHARRGLGLFGGLM